MRQLGMLVHDDEHGCEAIADWDETQPSPKVDNTAAERQRKRRAKLKKEREAAQGEPPVTLPSHRDTRDVTPGHPPVTPTKEKGKEKNYLAVVALRA